MKLTSILCALSAALFILAAGASAANAGHRNVYHAARIASGGHFLNPQPLPP